MSQPNNEHKLDERNVLGMCEPEILSIMYACYLDHLPSIYTKLSVPNTCSHLDYCSLTPLSVKQKKPSFDGFFI